jgi:precorrin-6x reductase
MDNTQDITKNTYASLKEECDAHGISLNRLCREAGVERSVFQRWKAKDPTSIQRLNSLKEALERLKQANTNT